jgi:hypothetical protein
MEAHKITFKVNKLDESAYFHGKNGDIYCSILIWPNRDGEDQYGNTCTLKQDLGADRREEKAQIIGNGKPLKKKNAPRSAPPANYEKLPTAAEMADSDDIPF